MSLEVWPNSWPRWMSITPILSNTDLTSLAPRALTTFVWNPQWTPKFWNVAGVVLLVASSFVGCSQRPRIPRYHWNVVNTWPKWTISPCGYHWPIPVTMVPGQPHPTLSFSSGTSVGICKTSWATIWHKGRMDFLLGNMTRKTPLDLKCTRYSDLNVDLGNVVKLHGIVMGHPSHDMGMGGWPSSNMGNLAKFWRWHMWYTYGIPLKH